MSIVRLGSFETIREVGAGGMGTVWEGKHVVTHAPVAVKFLTSERARDPRWLAAFHSEARAISRLEHPRVVRIYDVGTIPSGATLEGLPAGSPYIVMEWVPRSLDDVPRPLAWQMTHAILLEVLDALAHVHARDIVHRDIKPSNVLGKLGRLRIADFGIAKVEDDPDDTISGVSGTPYFMAPEQFTSTSGRVGSWTDLYAVGCLAYLLVTGKAPFQGESVVELASQHLNSAFPLDGLHDDLAQWLGRMTAKNPAARYRFASEAARDLAPIAQAYDEPSTSPTERWISPGDTATDTIPLTTVLLSFEGRPATVPIRVDAAMSVHVPAHVPDWRTPEAARAHVEHVQGAGLAVSTMRIPPFVGREEERDVLWDTFRSALLRGEPSASLITGPPGIGKSRLAAWLAERAHELGLAPHLGPVSCRTTDEPFTRMARDELGVEADDVDLIEERVDQRLAGSDVSQSERNAIVRFLAGELDASAPRERLDAMRASLNLCAGGRPLIVLLDDIDDAPAEVLEAVYHTIRAGEFVHFVMTTARAVPDPRQRLNLVELRGLDDAYLSRIVRDLAGLHQDLAADIVSIAQQNPGHAIRLVRGLVERGELRGGEHGFELLSSTTLEAPDAASLWRERLEHLVRHVGATSRSALEVAAVLGDEVIEQEWRAVADVASVYIPPALRGELDQRGFTTTTSQGWAFADPQLKQLVVQSAHDRNTWKTYVAAARQALPDADVARRAAWDFDAGLKLTAARGFLAAAGRAERLCQYTRAGRLINRVSEALAEVDDAEAVRLATEVDVLRSRIWGLERIADADDVAARAAQVASQHGWDDLLGRALEQRAAFARKRVDLGAAERLYREAHQAYERAAAVEGRGRALQGLGMVAVARGELREAENVYNEALGAFLPAKSLRGAAWCANGLGDVYRRLGELELARNWYERALNWFEQIGNSYGAMWCVHDLALTARASGELSAAAEGLAEAIGMARRLGQRVVAPRLNLGVLYVLLGEEERARPIFEEVLEESRLRAIDGEEAMARVCLLPCDAAAERWDDVSAQLAAAREKIGSLVDADLGAMAQHAASKAAEAGRAELAETLRSFARTQGVE